MSTIKNAKINVALFSKIRIIVLILALLTISAKAIAAESISDMELATLCGGWFYNPYCAISGDSCPEFVGCDELWQTKCRYCIPAIGEYCKDDWRLIPDRDGCRNGSKPCANVWMPPPDYTSRGWCNYLECIADNWPQGDYPDCSVAQIPTCDD